MHGITENQARCVSGLELIFLNNLLYNNINFEVFIDMEIK
jgi:hypothetical protein